MISFGFVLKILSLLFSILDGYFNLISLRFIVFISVSFLHFLLVPLWIYLLTHNFSNRTQKNIIKPNEFRKKKIIARRVLEWNIQSGNWGKCHLMTKAKEFYFLLINEEKKNSTTTILWTQLWTKLWTQTLSPIRIFFPKISITF